MIVNRSLMEWCVISIGTTFLLHSHKQKNWQWLGDPFIKVAFLAWLWIILVVTPFALSPNESFKIAVPWIRCVLLYAALKNWVLTDRKYLAILGNILASLLVFVIIDTIWQYIFGVSLTGNIRDEGGRLTGPMDNVKVGIFLAKMLFPCVGLFLIFKAENNISKARLLLGGGLLCTTIATIMLTGERTAFVSSMIAIFLSALMLALYEPRLRKKTTILLVIILTTTAFLIFTQEWVMLRAYEFYLTITNYKNSDYGKLAITGFLIGMSHPLTGAGLRSFRELCPTLNYSANTTYCNIHPHNPYMEWFAETGAVGLILFVLMICLLLYKCVTCFVKQNGHGRIISIFAFACIVTNFFPFMPTQSIFSNWPALMLWYSISVAMALLNVVERKKISS